MSYWELYYHVVWTTKYREPLIKPAIEPTIYHLLRNKAFGLEGIVHALNGIEDHVHMVVSIPPKIAVSKFVGEVKGATSSRYNQAFRIWKSPPLYWQNGYGVFSVYKHDLSRVVRYVERQKEHHRFNQLIPHLEQTEDPDADSQNTQIGEPLAIYHTNRNDH